MANPIDLLMDGCCGDCDMDPAKCIALGKCIYDDSTEEDIDDDETRMC